MRGWLTGCVRLILQNPRKATALRASWFPRTITMFILGSTGCPPRLMTPGLAPLHLATSIWILVARLPQSLPKTSQPSLHTSRHRPAMFLMTTEALLPLTSALLISSIAPLQVMSRQVCKRHRKLQTMLQSMMILTDRASQARKPALHWCHLGKRAVWLRLNLLCCLRTKKMLRK